MHGRDFQQCTNTYIYDTIHTQYTFKYTGFSNMSDMIKKRHTNCYGNSSVLYLMQTTIDTIMF